MSIKSSFLKTVTSVLGKQIDADEVEKARQEAEKVEQERVQREKKKQEELAAQAIAQKVADNKQRAQDKKEKREQKHEASLKSHLMSSLTTARIAKKAETSTEIKEFKEQLLFVLEQMADTNPNISYEIISDMPDYDGINSYLQANPEVIFSASADMSEEHVENLTTLGLDLEKISWTANQNKSAITQTLLEIFNLSQAAPDYTERKQPVSRIDINLPHANIQKLTVETKVESNFGSATISLQTKRKGSMGYQNVGIHASDMIIEHLLKCATSGNPEFGKPLQAAFADHAEKAERQETHMDRFGHLDFMPLPDDEPSILLAKLEARMAISVPKLKKSAGETYDLIMRPENKSYIDKVAKQVSKLDGQQLETGQILNVSKTKKSGRFTSLALEISPQNSGFSEQSQRIEIRWVKDYDRFDAAVTENGQTQIVKGPQEYRHDAQYHFINEQIGTWLKAQDPILAQKLFDKAPIYEASTNYAVAGYKQPKLMR